MSNDLTFQFNLLLTIDPAYANDVLQAAVATGDYGEGEPNSLKNALAVLLNHNGTDPFFQYLSEWEASPIDGRDLNLLDLAYAKLAEHNIDPTALVNNYGGNDGSFPHDRYFAVELGSNGQPWSFGGSTVEELVEAMDASEVQPARLVFVTDLLTGLDYEPGLSLTLR